MEVKLRYFSDLHFNESADVGLFAPFLSASLPPFTTWVDCKSLCLFFSFPCGTSFLWISPPLQVPLFQAKLVSEEIVRPLLEGPNNFVKGRVRFLENLIFSEEIVLPGLAYNLIGITYVTSSL